MAIDGISKLKTWGIKTIPTVYDNGQSLYEILGKIKYTINRMVEAGYIDYTSDFNDIIARFPDITGKLTSETAARESNDVVLKNLIQQEATARKSADDTLQSQIDLLKAEMARLAIKKNFVFLTDSSAAHELLEDFQRDFSDVCGIFITEITQKGISNCTSTTAGGYIDAVNNIEDTIKTQKGNENITDVIIFGGATEDVDSLDTGWTYLKGFLQGTFTKGVLSVCPFGASPWHDLLTLFRKYQTMAKSQPINILQDLYLLGTYLKGNDEATSKEKYEIYAYDEFITGYTYYRLKEHGTTLNAATLPQGLLGVDEIIYPYGQSVRLVTGKDYGFSYLDGGTYSPNKWDSSDSATLPWSFTATFAETNTIHDRPKCVIPCYRVAESYFQSSVPQGRGLIDCTVSADTLYFEPDKFAYDMGYGYYGNGSSSVKGYLIYMGEQEVQLDGYE